MSLETQASCFAVFDKIQPKKSDVCCANQLAMLLSPSPWRIKIRIQEKFVGYLRFKISSTPSSCFLTIWNRQIGSFPHGFMLSTNLLLASAKASAMFRFFPRSAPPLTAERSWPFGRWTSCLSPKMKVVFQQVAFDLREGLYHEQNESTLFVRISGDKLIPLSKRTWILTGTTILVPCLQFKPRKMGELPKRKRPSRLDLVLLPIHTDKYTKYI